MESRAESTIIVDSQPKAAAELARLEGELATVLARIEQIPADRDAAEVKIATAKETLASLETRVEFQREARQARLAENQDATAITKELAAIREEKELAEDTVIGLTAKLEALRQEELSLAAEDRPRLFQAIAKLKVAPLLEQYNTAAARLAEITEAICLTMEECRQPLGRGAVCWFWPTSWDSFETVPRLCTSGDPHEHFFHLPWFQYRRQEQHRAAQANPA